MNNKELIPVYRAFPLWDRPSNRSFIQYYPRQTWYKPETISTSWKHTVGQSLGAQKYFDNIVHYLILVSKLAWWVGEFFCNTFPKDIMPLPLTGPHVSIPMSWPREQRHHVFSSEEVLEIGIFSTINLMSTVLKKKTTLLSTLPYGRLWPQSTVTRFGPKVDQIGP